MHTTPGSIRQGSTQIQPVASSLLWAPEFIAEVRARVPTRLCSVCGASIGAARLTWRPDASTCAWCGDDRINSPQERPAILA